MPWSEHFALGVADMDATHRQFIEMADELLAVPDNGFLALFEQLQDHTIRHFEHEKTLMRACHFPAIGEHESEHLRVLGEIAYFANGLRRGRLKSAREYARGLPAWFATHLATMDAALASCLKRML
ncbi:MAG: hemerythrin family protein [Betaproteobacteria bacterium]|nr:hemerythrin family protein [Betaproteobacteria bacterium]